MAAVGAVYTIDPFVRTADEVIDEVMRKKAAQAPPKPAHKRVRAELLVGKVALFLWLADEVDASQPDGDQALDLPLGRGARVARSPERVLA